MDIKQKQGGMLVKYTFLVIFLIISIACITRATLKTVNSDKAKNNGYAVSEENTSQILMKKQLINKLQSEIIFDKKRQDSSKTYYIYTVYLKNHLSDTDLRLSEDTYQQLQKKTDELIRVIGIEKECDFNKMSLDTRAVSIDIAKKIYELCGLSLTTDMDGLIEQISDRSGNVLYDGMKELPVYHIQIYVLAAVLIIQLILLLIILVYVKKNHLFKKEDNFDEFNEKRYA